MRADVLVGNEILHVFSTHLIHTHQQPSKIQNEQASNLIKKLPRKRAIVMGDFNATQESFAIKSMQKAMLDSDPSAEPTWSVHPEGCVKCTPKGVDTRLDYIFTSYDIKTSSFKVEKSKASDHLPISVNIEI